VLAPNEIPTSRLGGEAKPFLWVVYNADYGTIVTGYQASGLDTINMPGTTRWLK
jgi:hypothetical protein